MLPLLLTELTSGDDARAIDAVQKISTFGRQALPSLTQLLNNPHADVRWWATCALSEIDDPEVGSLLCKSLKDPDLAVRECAALGLRFHPNSEFIPNLTETLNASPPLLTRLAADALTAIGKDAVPALLEIMKTGPHSARVEAVKALAEIKDPRSIETFFKAIQDGDSPLVEYWSDLGLDRLGVGMTFFTPG